jgi:E3 ubiquitin-protein ligase RNF144
VESNSGSEQNSSLGGGSERKEVSDGGEVLDNNVTASYNIEPKANSAFVEDLESEVAVTDFNLVTIEEADKIEGSPLLESLPVQNPQSDYRLNLTSADSLLVSVPENALLPDPEHLVPAKLPQSKESDSTSETQETQETYSESNSTAISASISSRTTGCSQFTKAEPLTAKQQVALWLTRTSTQDISQEITMSSLRNLINMKPNSTKYKASRQPAHSAATVSYSKKPQEMHRNLSTKSLMERSSISSVEQVGGQKQIRKCNTVLALSQEGRQQPSTGGKSHSTHGSQLVMYRSKKPGDMSSRNSLKSSKISIFKKRFSKCGSEVIPATFTSQATAPGQLCRSQAGADSPHPFPGLRPVNRLRSTSSVLQCSRCTSVLSVTASRMTSRATSQMSLLLDRKYARIPTQEDVQCKICLYDCPLSAMIKLDDCGCSFCKDCMQQYIMFEVMEGAYDISCPDPGCSNQGVLNQQQMESLTDRELMDKHRTFRLNTEVSLDAARTWCPSAGCDTICHICAGTKSQGVPVSCPTCVKEFCSLCSATWHPGLSCQENGALLVKAGGEAPDPFAWDLADENIKRCPMCSVPIERDAGCAQMMCKRCKHVFCWYCLTSLDDDFLLRHYDSGECQGKLGHSRASVICHRAQVIGIFAGFGILLLVASPLLLVAAPCIICCKCRACSKTDEATVKRVSSELVATKGSSKAGVS